VRDNVIGIDKKDHNRIFERFQQGGNTLTEKPAGTGLGLPISREILRHFDGEVWVESEIGKGATFSFRIPGADTRIRPRGGLARFPPRLAQQRVVIAGLDTASRVYPTCGA